MIINDLEQHLKDYCRTQNSLLFETYLYNPFRYMAAFIVKKYRVPSEEIEDMISDLVGYASVKLPEVYNENKGKAKSMLYVLMSQRLNNTLKYDERGKRNKKILVYLEDMDYESTEGITSIIEVEFDQLKVMKDTLLSSKELFQKLETKLQKKVAFQIIEFIEKSSEREDYIQHIAKKCKCKVNYVYKTIRDMREIMRIQFPKMA